MQDLGTLGGKASIGTGINASGQVTGSADISGTDMVAHAFMYDDGVMQDLGTLGGIGSAGTAINAAGDVTGSSNLNSSPTYHAFLYASGVMHDLGTLSGGTDSAGYGINAFGQVTGYSGDADGVMFGFVYTNDRMIDLNSMIGSAASTYTIESGMAINDAGQIVADGYINKGKRPTALLLTPIPSD